MSLTSLRISRFRNLAPLDLALNTQGMHFFFGNNGSGKTSLLEAVYFLGSTCSFRTHQLDHLIQEGSSELSVFGVDSKNQAAGVAKKHNHTATVQLGYQSASPVQLRDFLPILLINTDSLDLLNKGPLFRRQLLDWGMFHVEPSFRATWRQWVAAVKQRNAALKQKRPKAECQTWDPEIARLGEAIHQSRVRFLERYCPHVHICLSELLNLRGFSFEYLPGWPQTKTLFETLQETFFLDLKQGFTQYGPHRADMLIQWKGVLCRERLSRGQQKLVACAFKLAQGQLFLDATQKPCLYLLDDLQSELDHDARDRLLALLRMQASQAFITGIDNASLSSAVRPGQDCVFHVEHGGLV